MTEKSPARKNSAILRPHMTEKGTMNTRGGGSVYTFVVSSLAGKADIREEIVHRYGVKPRMVRVLRVKPQVIVVRGRRGKKPGFKKAVIYLHPGDVIEYA